MNFLSIPKNGSSWHEPLLYIFTVGSKAKDVEVVVRDTINAREVSRMRLYGVTYAEVDIAPLIRSYMAEPVVATVEGFTRSSVACRVEVVVDGVVSESRTLFRAAVDYAVGMVLSEHTPNRHVGRGDTIRLTILATKDIVVRMVCDDDIAKSWQVRLLTDGMPYEFVYSVADLDSRIQRFHLDVMCNGYLVKSFNYTIEQYDDTAKQMLWHNEKGGVECYTFPRSRRSKCSVTFRGTSLESSQMESRLYSGHEASDEMERIAGILRSPTLYECNGWMVTPVDLKTRGVTMDEHGTLRHLDIDIVKPWKGGGL